MMLLTQRQWHILDADAKARFPARIRAHWAAALPAATALFSHDELDTIAGKVTVQGLAKVPQSEADIVLSADLWLLELARRRSPQP